MLTPEQIQQYRQQYNITPVTSTGETPQTPKIQAIDRISALRAGTYGTTGAPKAPITPVEPTEQPKEISTGGRIIRGALRPIASVAMSALNLDQTLGGEPVTEKAEGPLARYIEQDQEGPIQRVGATFDPSKGFTPENVEALRDAARKGIDIGLLVSGGGTAEQAAKTGAKGFIKQAATQGAKEGLTQGVVHGASTVIDKDTSVLDAAGNAVVEGAGGALLGGAAGVAGGLVSKEGRTALKEGMAARSARLQKPVDTAFEESLSVAGKKLNPTGEFSAKESSEILGEKTKTKGKGIFKRDVPVQDTSPEAQAIAELHQQGELPKTNTSGQDVQKIKEVANRHAMANDEFINEQGKDILVNTNDTETTLNQVLEKARKDRVFLSDSAEEKAYRDVMDVAREEIEANKGNLPGLRNAVKTFNRRMEDILGKDIYTPGGIPTTTGQARVQAAKDVRHALNDYVQEALNRGGIDLSGTRGDLFKDTLRREATLRSAADQIKHRAGKTLGESRATRFLNSNKGRNLVRILRNLGYGVAIAEGGVLAVRGFGED